MYPAAAAAAATSEDRHRQISCSIVCRLLHISQMNSALSTSPFSPHPHPLPHFKCGLSLVISFVVGQFEFMQMWTIYLKPQLSLPPFRGRCCMKKMMAKIERKWAVATCSVLGHFLYFPDQHTSIPKSWPRRTQLGQCLGQRC